MPSTRRSFTQVRQQALEEASTMLKDLPEKTKESWSLREAIDVLRGDIDAALDRGYSYEEIADTLSEEDIKISPSSLKSYLASSHKNSGENGGGKRRRRRRSSSVAEDEQNEEVTPTEEAPTRRRTRAASAPRAARTRRRTS